MVATLVVQFLAVCLLTVLAVVFVFGPIEREDWAWLFAYFYVTTTALMWASTVM